VAPFDVDAIRIERGEVYVSATAGQTNGAYARFAPTPSGVSPRALLGQPGGMHWLTGGEHTEYGRVTEDPVVRERMMEKRAQKLAFAAREIPAEEKLQVYGARYAHLTVVSWGSNKGAILEALQRLALDGIAARLVQVRLLWPFPAEEILPWLETATPLVVVELNYSGQLAQLMREQTGRPHDYLVVKYNGRPMTGQELYRAFTAIHTRRSTPRVVLRNPYE
jgi:2-oxoglutarate ferredoxin oxidoreductase subunit alpha